MVTKETLNRIAQLNKGSLKYAQEIEGKADKISCSDTSKNNTFVSEPALRIRGKKVEYINIEDAVPGQVTKEEDGEFLLIKQRFRDLSSNAREAITAFPSSIRSQTFERAVPKDTKYGAGGAGNEQLNSLAMLSSVHPSKILFLDIETCGLTASPLFLIGVAYFTGEDFSFLQLFARDLHEERPLLSFFNRLFSQYDLLITFNGKSFDFPFIVSRGHANRVRINEEIAHIDLLHEVRRRWRHRLPNCKLQTVERFIFKRKRFGDISGSEIPQVYREFIRTGNASNIKAVLKHNVLDIVTMIDIILQCTLQHDS